MRQNGTCLQEFRSRLRTGKLHRCNARHTPDDFSLSGMSEFPYFVIRTWIRNRQERSLLYLAPTANKFLAKLNEIDWTVMFVLPLDLRRLSLVLVDLNDGAWS